jgi:hypothetical protein
VKEIHGYVPDYGLCVFTEQALALAAGKRHDHEELSTVGGTP